MAIRHLTAIVAAAAAGVVAAAGDARAIRPPPPLGPQVTWTPPTGGEGGTYTVTGLPAISADGTHLLYAIIDGNEMFETDLMLVETTLDNRVTAKLAMPTLGTDAAHADVMPAPTPDALARLTAFLRSSQTARGWVPLEMMPLDFGDHAEFGSYTLDVGGDGTAVTLADTKAKLATFALDKDVAAYYRGHWKSSEGSRCPGHPHVTGIAVDRPHRIAVVEINLVTRDGCDLETVYAAHRLR